MLALQFHEYGGPQVLVLGEAPQPHARAGQVRIRVRAASVNPFDCKLRAGYLSEMVPLTFPAIPGTDASGVVDEVGDGVENVQVDDAVFGVVSQTSAEYAVLDYVAAKPDDLPFEEAAGMGLAVEAAARCLDTLDLPAGATVLVDGAAGGVGSALVQLAVARGLHVIGTASETQPRVPGFTRGPGNHLRPGARRTGGCPHAPRRRGVRPAREGLRGRPGRDHHRPVAGGQSSRLHRIRL